MTTRSNRSLLLSCCAAVALLATATADDKFAHTVHVHPDTQAVTFARPHDGRSLKEVDVLHLQLNNKLHSFSRTDHDEDSHRFLGFDEDQQAQVNVGHDDTDTFMGSVVSVGDNVVYQFRTDADGNTRVVTRNMDDFREESDDDLYSDTDQHDRALMESVVKSDNNNAVVVVDDHRELQSKPIVDVMVVWTRASECKNSKISSTTCTVTAQTTKNMLNLANQAVSETNTAMASSKANVELRLVHAYGELDYVETEKRTDVNRLQTEGDGFMDDVHVNRRKYGADIVILLFHDLSTCGMGQRNYPDPVASKMFAAISWDCATGYYSFGHELAHLMGCDHDRGSMDMCDASGSFYGFRAPNAGYRDIMAMSCREDQCDNMPRRGCPRIPFFSTDLANSPYGLIGDNKSTCSRQLTSVAQKTADLMEIVPETPVPTKPLTKSPTKAPTLSPMRAPTPAPSVNKCGNGVCEAGENCNTCPSDCAKGTFNFAVCGNGVCEAGDGENMINCPYDCRTDRTGRITLNCGLNGQCESDCNEGRFVCTTFSAGSVESCCGNSVCSQGENSRTCPVDCK